MIERIHSNPQIPQSVILNLFQDPSGRKNRSPRLARYAAQPGGERAKPRFGQAEKWTLKQVQGDEGRLEWPTLDIPDPVQEGLK